MALAWATTPTRNAPAPSSRRGPAAVDRKICAGNRLGRIGAKINSQVGDLVDSDEFLRWLRRQQHVALDLLFGHAAGGCGVRKLLFDETSRYIARCERRAQAPT